MDSPERGRPECPRRPVKARETRWAAAAAARLAGMGVRPNAISLASVVFAALAGACALLSSRACPVAAPACLVLAAVFVQLRLLCNLFDGMVAVEGGFRTKSGEIFNDLPDRLADPLVLVPAGYAVGGSPVFAALGWLAALLAVLTAYARVLAGSAGATQRFLGPMAKQHRMALMTGAFLLAAAGHPFGWHRPILAAALCIVIAGSLVTLCRRVRRAVRDLEARG